MLPTKIIKAMIGLVICFFGGVFPLTIAAVEAWKVCGGDEALEALKELRADFVRVKDDVEADMCGGDEGKQSSDVKQLTGKELVMRETKLVLKVVKPDHVSTQLACLHTGWVGVVATLKVEFAKTVALGHAIGHRLYRLA